MPVTSAPPPPDPTAGPTTDDTADPTAGPRADRRAWSAFAVLALPLLLVSMDVSILYVAAPRITADLHASATQQLWIFDVYGFVLAGLLITMGAVADRIGCRRLLLLGAVGFSLTSVAAASCQSAGQLIAARAVLGLAGATLMPSTLAMVRTLFPHPADRARAVAAWTGIMTAGVSLGPVLGGVLLQHFAWGSVFWVNVPAMLLLLTVGPVLLPRTPGRPGAPFDLLGSALSLGAVLPTVYGVKEWAAQGFDVRWPVAVAVGLAFTAAFVHRLRTHRHPLVPRHLLAHRAYLGAVGADAVATFALVGNAVLVTAYLQLVLGMSPLAAALWSLVPAVGVAAATPVASALGPRVGRPAVMAGGFAVAASGFGVLTATGTHSLVVVLVGAGVLAGGLVAAMTMSAEQVLAAVGPEQAGSGSAVAESATELGGSLGIAVLGSVSAAVYRSSADGSLPADLVHGPAGGSLAGAASVAGGLPGDLGAQVLTAARAAFADGLQAAALVGAGVLLVAALVAAAAALTAARARSGRD